MPILKMTKDKTLSITKSSNTYQDENNAETLKIILSKTINNIDLKECEVWLSFINQENKGQTKEISQSMSDYSDAYYVIEIPMYNTFTYMAGTIKMWLKILHSPTEMIAKTRAVEYIIQPHQEVEGTIPEHEISIIDSLTMRLDATAIKVDEMSGKIEEIDTYMSELQEGEVLLVQGTNDK